MIKQVTHNIIRLLKQTFLEFQQDKIMKLSASLAYYTIFSLPPMLLIIISLCDIFYGKEAAEGVVFDQIKGIVGARSAELIESTLKNVSLTHNATIATIIGVVTLFIGATGVFNEIQDSINQIWGLKAKPSKAKKGLLKIVINRLISFSMIISLGFVLMVSLILNGLIESFIHRLTELFPEGEVYLIYSANLFITFLITSGLFAIIFKVLPDARIRWKDIGIGAIVTGVLFMIGKFLIGVYLTNSTVSNAYGAAGSAILTLLWVYYSAVILYFGAEFTQVYAQMFGGDLHPNDYAVWIEKKEVELTEAQKEIEIAHMSKTE
ncbi:YihY/virulence factor BrkB family protein [Solitalea canadensis]|uniref:Putative membrane protein n=1 Tax=Solitalea canadensis (strain ATCC 29591 / DSM 3403 / JCM 21819 / LMG 8368 / NBRC 15130 / NCIMB 12057 / USAM 9D) TaxID=929556 RepID=H8KNB9_SOLCM|nr:YihY/virulence factor BrkB family protein [Solitalea canadensis]AFD09452.1 putative membrane protein [Solitalea canadensis DSM 3403]